MTPTERMEMENGIPYRYGQALELLKMVLEGQYGAAERAREFVAGEEARLARGSR